MVNKWVDLFQSGLDASNGGFYIFMTVEGTDANMTFPAAAKSWAWCCHDTRLGKQKIEKRPGILARVDPDVR